MCLPQLEVNHLLSTYPPGKNRHDLHSKSDELNVKETVNVSIAERLNCSYLRCKCLAFSYMRICYCIRPEFQNSFRLTSGKLLSEKCLYCKIYLNSLNGKMGNIKV